MRLCGGLFYHMMHFRLDFSLLRFKNQLVKALKRMLSFWLWLFRLWLPLYSGVISAWRPISYEMSRSYAF